MKRRKLLLTSEHENPIKLNSRKLQAVIKMKNLLIKAKLSERMNLNTLTRKKINQLAILCFKNPLRVMRPSCSSCEVRLPSKFRLAVGALRTDKFRGVLWN